MLETEPSRPSFEVGLEFSVADDEDGTVGSCVGCGVEQVLEPPFRRQFSHHAQDRPAGFDSQLPPGFGWRRAGAKAVLDRNRRGDHRGVADQPPGSFDDGFEGRQSGRTPVGQNPVEGVAAQVVRAAEGPDQERPAIDSGGDGLEVIVGKEGHDEVGVGGQPPQGGEVGSNVGGTAFLPQRRNGPLVIGKATLEVGAADEEESCLDTGRVQGAGPVLGDGRRAGELVRGDRQSDPHGQSIPEDGAGRSGRCRRLSEPTYGGAIGYTVAMNGLMMRRLWRLIGVFAGMAICSTVWAGEQEQARAETVPGFSDSVEVNVVNVDAYVRDHKGRPVGGLGREDFVVSVDGQRREISHFAVMNEEVFERFEEQDLLGPDAVAAPRSEDGEELEVRPAWVVIYIDQENLHPLDRTRVLRRVREFVMNTLKPPVRMMIVANEDTSLQVKQVFSNDPREVTGVLRGMGKYSGGWLDRQSTRTDLVERMRDLKGEKGQSSQSHGSRQLFQEVISYAREEAFLLSQSLDSIRQVVQMLSGLEGRKSIVYVSNGLPMTPGLGLMHEYASLFHDNSILAYRARFERQDLYRALAASASAQDVIMYTLDAGGLEVTIGGGADQAYGSDPTSVQVGSSNFQSSLRYLAERTGGIAIINSNDVSAGLERIREDLFSYYSIGFLTNHTGSDSVHSITVTLPGHPDLDVRHRGRFVDKSLETSVQDEVLSALLLGIKDNPMGVEIERKKPIPATGQRWTVPVEVSVPYSELALLPMGDDRVGHVVLVVGARDEMGGRSEVRREEHEIRVPGTADLEGTRWSLESRFLMEEGSNRIVVGILDRITRKVSYASLTITLP